MAKSVLGGKHITLNAFANKQDKRKTKALRFQLKRVESKKPRVKGQETKQTVEFIHGEEGN